MTVPLVQRLGRPEADPSALGSVGGKGAAIDAMIAAGLPVPATAAVTTAAYRRIEARPGIAALLASLDAQPVVDDTIDDSDVDSVFAASAGDERLRRDILAARREVAPEGPVAIRSSATTEDLGGASFAGQYRSVLGVDSDEEVIAAVTSVWASLWHQAPRLYRRLHGIADRRAQMAVLIQAMVPATSAGVVFTVDPAGSPADIRVERVDGLGESLVSGSVTPTVHLLPRGSRAPLGVPTDVRAAAILALRCEALFDSAQDVEWAADGTGVWVVQSRPITTGGSTDPRSDDDGFGTRLDPQRRYTTAGVGEMLPGVLPARVWSTAGFIVEEAYRAVVDRLGALPDGILDDNGFVARARGRAALDLDHMNEVARRLPGGSPDEIEEQFFGSRAPVGSVTADEQSPPSRWQRIVHDLRVFEAHRIARSECAITRQAIDGVLAHELDRSSPNDDLLALRARLVDLAARATVAEFSVAAAAVAAFHRLETALCRYFGSTAGKRWALRAASSLRPETIVERTESVAEQLLVDHPDVLTTTRWDDARTRLAQLDRHDLVAQIEAVAQGSGSRRVVAGRTWSEVPDEFWNLVRARSAQSRSRSPTEANSSSIDLEAALVALPHWRRTRLLTGQIVDVRRQLVRRLVRNAVELLEQRETTKSMLLALGGRIREIDVESGRRLARRGLLLLESDIDHLHSSEIREVLLGDRAIGQDVILARRRCFERWTAEPELPLTFVGQPTVMPDAPSSGDRLEGWGASPGRHTGLVKFLRSPNDREVEPGDVVVALRTDASWSPVFLRASAVIVEEGGPLSHAAIVAREFGLPAVLNVPGATIRLRDEPGLVTVDGDSGKVFITSAEDDESGNSNGEPTVGQAT